MNRLSRLAMWSCWSCSPGPYACREPDVEAFAEPMPAVSSAPAVRLRGGGSHLPTLPASGITPRSLTDCLVAAVATRTNPLLHADADFDRMAPVIGLQLA